MTSTYTKFDLLNNQQQTRIERDFMDFHFDGDLLADIADANTDAKKIALVTKLQNLWREQASQLADSVLSA